MSCFISGIPNFFYMAFIRKCLMFRCSTPLNISFDEVIVSPDTICKLALATGRFRVSPMPSQGLSMTSSKRIPLSIHFKVSFVMAEVVKVLVIFILRACTTAKVIAFDQIRLIWGRVTQLMNLCTAVVSCFILSEIAQKNLILEYCNLNSKQQRDTELLGYCSNDTLALHPGQQSSNFLQNWVVLAPHFLKDQM